MPALHSGLGAHGHVGGDAHEDENPSTPAACSWRLELDGKSLSVWVGEGVGWELQRSQSPPAICPDLRCLVGGGRDWPQWLAIGPKDSTAASVMRIDLSTNSPASYWREGSSAFSTRRGARRRAGSCVVAVIPTDAQGHSANISERQDRCLRRAGGI